MFFINKSTLMEDEAKLNLGKGNRFPLLERVKDMILASPRNCTNCELAQFCYVRTEMNLKGNNV